MPSLGDNQPPATPQATQPQRGHAPPISHSPCTFLSLGCPHGQSGCNSLPFVPRGGAPGIILTGSRLLRTAPRAAQSPPKPPPITIQLCSDEHRSPSDHSQHPRSLPFAVREPYWPERPVRPYRGPPEAPEGSHGPPEVPIHLVPPLGGLLSTRGGHGKELQPCFTIRDILTDRTASCELPRVPTVRRARVRASVLSTCYTCYPTRRVVAH